MAKLNTQKWENFYSPYKAEKRQAAIAEYDTQVKTLNDSYNTQIKETESTYTDQYRENAVQRLINEREIAESMANFGLGGSGVEKTQKKAVDLSYGKSKAKIDRQKNLMLDNLKKQLTSGLKQIETNRTNTLAEIDDEFSSLSAKAAQNEYESAVKYESEIENARIAAEEKKKSKVVYTYTGEDGANLNNNKYLASDGNVYSFAKGINPYTGANNTALGVKGKGFPTTGSDAQKGAYVYGVFSNGYQPKGVYSGGTNYGEVKNSNQKLSDNRTVWYTNTRYGVHYWIWSGYNNSYIEVAAAGTDENGNTQWVAV